MILRQAIWAVGAILALASTSFAQTQTQTSTSEYFQRRSTFLICKQLDPDCNTDNKASAKIVANFDDFLVYTDVENNQIGFVNFEDPSNPTAEGAINLTGIPTSVKVLADRILVTLDTSINIPGPSNDVFSGKLAVINKTTRALVQEIELPGQPSGFDIPKEDQSFPWNIPIAIMNKRDDSGSTGSVAIIVIEDDGALEIPNQWSVREVDLIDLDSNCLSPSDPEPKSVALSEDGVLAIVTMSQNNCVVVVDVTLTSGAIIDSYNAGSEILNEVDLIFDYMIFQTQTSDLLLREPSDVTWIGDSNLYATANSGTRGFSIHESGFESNRIVYDSGNNLEHEAVRIGHYPDVESERDGTTPRSILYAEFGERGEHEFLFVAAARANIIFVYDISVPQAPVLRQTMPVGVSPDGLLAIPEKNLLVVASETDNRAKKVRASIAIFELVLTDGQPEYPTVVTNPRDTGSFIPFSSISGLTAAAPFGVETDADPGVMFAVEDAYYRKTRIFTIDTSSFPAVVTREQRILDTEGILADYLDGNLGVGQEVDFYVDDVDMTVSIDIEGISVSSTGGFWIIAEGTGTLGDEQEPYKFPNLLLKLTDDAVISECIPLPDDWPGQDKADFNGVAEDGNNVVINIQRARTEEDNPRIAVYNTVSKIWSYVLYPLDEPKSQLDKIFVGLSDIAVAGPGKFYVLEKDNQGSADAGIKQITSIDLGDYSFVDGTTVEKTLYRDLLPDLLRTNGQVLEKVEGLTVNSDGTVWIITDNDAVRENELGEQLFLSVGAIPSCVNYPDRFKVEGKFKTCSEIEALDWKKRKKKCKNDKIFEKCPGICNKERCPCENISVPLNKKGKTCEQLAKKKEKSRTKLCQSKNLYSKNCPGICSVECSGLAE